MTRSRLLPSGRYTMAMGEDPVSPTDEFVAKGLASGCGVLYIPCAPVRHGLADQTVHSKYIARR